MKKECIFYQMWSKQIQAAHEEKAEVYLSIGAELRDDLLMSINISANNRAFLMELDQIILKGYNYCDMWLRGLLSNYVKRRSMEDNNSPYQVEYYTSWLNNTILILNGNYPVIKEWCEEYKTWINQYYKDLSDGHGVNRCFRNIIQYENKEKLLKRLHSLIDGKWGADVGSVLLSARLNNYLTRNPTQAEFKSEFELIGTWSAITNYMNDNNQNALDRANKIVIFE